MNKKNWHTISAIITSVLLSVVGWLITEKLLEQNEKKMFLQTEIIQIGNLEYLNQSENDSIENKVDDTAPINMENWEISEVLKNWESRENPELHEPMPGQINMAQAIEAGKEWIAFMCNNGVLSKEIFFDGEEKISASLCLNNTENVKEKLENKMYSFWMVSFLTDDGKVELYIHAATGQIWSASIYSYRSDVDLLNTKLEDILEFFVSYIGLKDGPVVMLNEYAGYKTIEENGLYAVIYRSQINVNDKIGGESENSSWSQLNILLSSQYDF